MSLKVHQIISINFSSKYNISKFSVKELEVANQVVEIYLWTNTENQVVLLG